MRSHPTSPAITLCACIALLAACSTPPTGNQGFVGFDLGGSAADTGVSGTDAVTRADTGGATADGAAKDGGGTGQDGGGAADSGAGVGDGGAMADGGVTDGGAADTAVTQLDVAQLDVAQPDVAQLDTAQPDTAQPDTAQPDTAQLDTAQPDADPGTDVPWGSPSDAGPYDAGQYNYADVKSTGGSTGSGGAGLCIPKISQLNLEKIKVGGKVDIIIFVDTSGSMGQEAKYVTANLNAFGSYLAGKALDYRVILLGKDTSCCKLTIGPPLGTNPAVFKHVKSPVYSTDGLKRIIDYYPQYQAFLRKDATKNFLAITDDESFQMTSTVFEQKLLALQNPGFAQGFVFHSICAYGPIAKKGCPTGARIGYQYLALTAKTGGVKAPVCDNNWSKIFNDIAKGVVNTAKPPCTHTIPLPTGVSSAKGVTVNYVAEDDFFNVPPAQNNACPANGIGYTLNNPANPTKLTLCNKSCDLLKGGGNIQFDFGCFL